MNDVSAALRENLTQAHCFGDDPVFVALFLAGNIIAGLSCLGVTALSWHSRQSASAISGTALAVLGAFAMVTGAGYLTDAVALWTGWYQAEAASEAVVGLASLLTFGAVWHVRGRLKQSATALSSQGMTRDGLLAATLDLGLAAEAGSRSPLGTICVSQGRKILWCNPKFCEHLKTSPKKLVGEDFLLRVHPDNRPRTRAAWEGHGGRMIEEGTEDVATEEAIEEVDGFLNWWECDDGSWVRLKWHTVDSPLVQEPGVVVACAEAVERAAEVESESE